MDVSITKPTTGMFNGNEKTSQRQNARMEDTKGKLKNGSINASELNLPEDNITQKKLNAKKKASDFIMQQFKVDDKLDTNLDARRDKITKLNKDIDDSNKKLKEFEQKVAILKESYKVDINSQEQKDLEILIKYEKSKNPIKDVTLTAEENYRLTEIGNLTEYQDKALLLEKTKMKYQDEIEESRASVRRETKIINAVKQELLKYHNMVDAKKSSDEVLEESKDEIVSLLLEEAKNHIEEEQKEAMERAKKSKADAEKLLEAKNASKKDNDELKKITTQVINQQYDAGNQKYANKSKVITDDIKGITINQIS